MKNILILLFLAFCFVGYGQIIDFPDANFKNALVNTKCVDTDGDNVGDADADLNDDGEIDLSEAIKVTSLHISNKLISNLEGINKFENLINLKCNDNLITSLDVLELLFLENLDCQNNQLSNLNVQGLIKLKVMDCRNNNLSSLELNGLINLIELDCAINKINSLNVKGLSNLELLECEVNHLELLDVQGLQNLKNIVCVDNRLTTLNVQGVVSLVVLWCFNNNLASLNLTGLTNLKELICHSNQLHTIDMDGLKSLELLACQKNRLTNLKVENLINLKEIYCNENQIINLDLHGLDNLFGFVCFNNNLTILNVDGLKKLEYLSCNHNQLSAIYLKGTKVDIGNFEFYNNPLLKYICCDEKIINVVKDKTITNGQNCEVNSYCSFKPGGKIYIIQGKNTYDGNNNSCDEQDVKIPNIKYNITNGNNSGTFVSNSTGNYTIPVQEGNHAITPVLEYLENFEVTPPFITLTFPNTTDTITQDFCITPKGILRQINITIIPLSPPARPGFEAFYKIVWENVGNQVESSTLNFTYDETLLDYISATQTADQIADGIVMWNFTNLLPFEKREIIVTVKVNRPTDTPAVNEGDKLYFTASILDNIFTLENTVVGSYDPNDKTCLQGDRVKPDMVGEYVDYLIRFENTGSYAAENVVVKDIIDTKTFDISTLKITDASHEVYTRIEGNKVEFIFENIQLPFDDANNDGYIAFKIKTLPSLVLGDSLKNLADIYFDYNFPIRTNEAQTTVAFPVFTKDNTTEVNIYPNPVTDVLYLETDENWSKAEIFDIAGRIMRSISLDSSSMDVSGLESGTYFVRLKDEEKVGLVKFVKI